MRFMQKLFCWSEIEDSVILRWYGALLALHHLLTAFFWRGQFLFRFSGELGVTCHKIWPWCSPQLVSDTSTALALLAVYVVLAAFAGNLFLFHPLRLAPAMATLVAATALKFFFFAHDYSFMGNYHYMPLWVTAVYVFGRSRRIAIPLLIVSFYVAAGFLKFNTQWVLGEGLARPAFLSPLRFAGLCIAVVLLETIGVFGLLSARKAPRWTALVCLSVFHAISYYWVDYFYPLTMFGLLSIFPFLWILDPTRTPTWESLGTVPISAALPAFLFALFQLPPHFSTGDAAITSQGREYSLNMFDARTTCFDLSFLKVGNSVIETSSASFRGHQARVHCDPLLFTEELHGYCRKLQGQREFESASLYLVSKRITDPNYTSVLSAQDFCEGAQR